MAKKKHIPQGQLNKNQLVFRRLHNLMKDLGQNFSIKVGIIGDKAYQQHEHSDLTMADLGAVHEFGATINVTDKMRGWFWYNAGIHKSNKPIIIPTRSFLRMPLLSSEGKRAINKLINEYLSKDREYNLEVIAKQGDVLRMIAELVAVKALERVNEAFITSGFGNWPKITPFTISRRKGDGDNNPLDDTGDLWDSITAVVKSSNYEQKLNIQGNK